VINRRREIADSILLPLPDGGSSLPEARSSEEWPLQDDWDACVQRWASDYAKNNKEPTKGKYPRPLTDKVMLLGWCCLVDDKIQYIKIPKTRVLPFETSELKPITANDFPKTLDSLTHAVRKNNTDKDFSLPTNLEKKDAGQAVSNAIAGQVIEAAGLVAAIDVIQRDVKQRGWRMVRRAHHQAAADSAPLPLTSFLPATPSDGTLPSAADSAMHAFHLFEWMGFAVDLAVVDDLNKAFNQRDLLGLLYAFDWEGVLSSVTAPHRVYIAVGREPGTKLPEFDSGVMKDDPESLGYGFVKLAVVPEAFLAAVGRKLGITKVDTNGNTKVTFAGNIPDASRLRFLWTKGSLPFFWSDPIREAQNAGVPVDIAVTSPPSWFTHDNIQNIHASITNVTVLKNWLTLRRITIPESGPTDGVDPFVVLAEIIKGLDATSLSNDSDDGVKPRLVVLERWAKRWQEIPAIGGRSRISWDAPDRLGRRVRFAIRRVSRYERYFKWLNSSADPPLTFPEDKCFVEVDLDRTLIQGDEPRKVNVWVVPHPTRIQFAYKLPSTAAQSLLSAEAATRYGFAEIDAGFKVSMPDGVFDSGTINPSSLAPPSQDDLIQATINRPSDDPEKGLLRMERMVALPNFPYHLICSMDAEQSFSADVSETQDSLVKLLGSNINPGLSNRRNALGLSAADDPKAQRLPSVIAVWKPTVKVSEMSETLTIEFQIHLSRYQDLMTDDEKELATVLDKSLKASWPTITANQTDHSIPLRMCPDKTVGYVISLVDPIIGKTPRYETEIANIVVEQSDMLKWKVTKVQFSGPPEIIKTQFIGTDQGIMTFQLLVTLSFDKSERLKLGPVAELLKKPTNFRLRAVRDGHSVTTEAIDGTASL
jgi:hypothetical protein